jgi:hypothetical protein
MRRIIAVAVVAIHGLIAVGVVTAVRPDIATGFLAGYLDGVTAFARPARAVLVPNQPEFVGPPAP